MNEPETITPSELERHHGPFSAVEAPVGGRGAIRRIRNGYMEEVLGNRTLYLGCEVGDRMFTHPDVGSVNISRARRLLKAQRRSKALRMEISQDMVENAKQIPLDQEIVDGLTIQQRNEPVLFADLDDKLVLLGGWHQIRRRVDEGCKSIKYLALDDKFVKAVQAECFRFDGLVWRRMKLDDVIAHMRNVDSRVWTVKIKLPSLQREIISLKRQRDDAILARTKAGQAEAI